MTRTPADVPNAPAGNKRLADVIVRLRGADYPLAAGLVAAVAHRTRRQRRTAEPVRPHPQAEPAQIADLPVVDDERRLLGVMTVDDVLEVTLPEDWRRRKAAAPPDTRHGNAR